MKNQEAGAAKASLPFEGKCRNLTGVLSENIVEQTDSEKTDRKCQVVRFFCLTDMT